MNKVKHQKKKNSILCTQVKLIFTLIQNAAEPQQNGRILKVFELAKPRFCRDMERNFCI